ncbi:MAG TPA: PQQ-binding-like beta-propeller repeat protein [Candidatus Acidoferrales bacterium]|nr:PQQ-binding-like beta-propeller repeat protein [Candidatus Acidoferrales bacterium]
MKLTRKLVLTIAILLIVSMTTSTLMTPALAQSFTGHKKSYAYIGATPNPVAVGEQVLLHIGITEALQITEDKWRGLTVTITKPDNKTETLGPFDTDSTGGTGTVYVPDQEGTYKLQTHFPAQWYNYSSFDIFSMTMSNVKCYYEADDSDILELAVGAEASQFWPGFGLPTEYWSRPIDSQIREWNVISGSWLSPSSIFGNDQSAGLGQDDAPETAHVLWQKQLQIGGLAGGIGLSEQAAIFPGDAYEGKFSSSLVIMGILIYQKFDAVGGNKTNNWICAVDMHTGVTLWEKTLYNPSGNVVVPQYGQIMYWKSFNTQGVHAYLFCGISGGFFGGASSTLEAFDPYTGRWLFTYTNMPSGSRMYGPNGEILIYTVNQQAGYMTLWNSTALIDAYWGTTQNSPNFGSWQPQGKTINATGPCPKTTATPYGYNGYTLNITIPKGLPGSVQLAYYDDVIVGYQRLETYGFFNSITLNDAPFVIWAFDAQTGALKFNKTHSAPPGNITLSVACGSQEERLICIWSKELTQFWAYSIDTGEKVWGPTPAQNYLDVFAMYPQIKYGILYSNGMSGIMYAYDAQSGDQLWNYTYKDPYSETLWSDYWSSLRPRIISDGKIYLGQSEHSVNQPQPRGAPFVCLNATTGKEIWSIAGMLRQTDWGGSAVMGDSIIATMDTYNQMIYAIGKGATATTISAPDIGVDYGRSITLKGTVLDVSPGTSSEKVKLRFPNGVAAVSDGTMSDWMLYVYKQFNPPTNGTGVEVSINVLDSNGNYRTIGTTTTDTQGFYTYSWTPDIPGEYKVYAVFSGSKGYYGSQSESSFTVEQAPQPTPTQQTQTALPPFELYMVALSLVFIIALAVATLLIVRKRP